MDWMEFLVLQVLVAQQVHQEHLVLMGHLERVDHQEQEEQVDHQDHLGQVGLLDQVGHQEHQV
jgi:hypothetical protein